MGKIALIQRIIGGRLPVLLGRLVVLIVLDDVLILPHHRHNPMPVGLSSFKSPQ
jgi:hypothetical protein